MLKFIKKILIVICLSNIAIYCLISYSQGPCTAILERQVTVDLLPELTKDLRSEISCVRSLAAYQVQQIGKPAADLVPRLIELTSDEDASVRWRSVAALGYVGVKSDSVEKALITALGDSNPNAVVNAMFSLTELQYFAHIDKIDALFYSENPTIKAKSLIYFSSLPSGNYPQVEARVLEVFKLDDERSIPWALKIIETQNYVSAIPFLKAYIIKPYEPNNREREANRSWSRELIKKFEIFGQDIASGEN